MSEENDYIINSSCTHSLTLSHWPISISRFNAQPLNEMHAIIISLPGTVVLPAVIGIVVMSITLVVVGAMVAVASGPVAVEVVATLAAAVVGLMVVATDGSVVVTASVVVGGCTSV